MALFLTVPGSLASSSDSGTFLAPITWPAANSAGSLTSTTTALSRFMSCTASTVVSEPARAPAETMGHSSMAPDENATASKIQLSMKKLTRTPFE
ncbi:hypothetical protein FQZ97_1233580 [compost metagenome]